eukprot:CAMPEP_0184293614 /NCGR_PEP_ID=MMETSP1049-20130417/4994_1 /TAXON_ID=77928 /ORGANISM="Proteomonas sulcata, Strain CCMP704" /LENGTH=131 /DNA_ID=CAMNT_0026601633 /DNA_START=943 /DNA_END=1338 /DNA_ORIENTATION=+
MLSGDHYKLDASIVERIPEIAIASRWHVEPLSEGHTTLPLAVIPKIAPCGVESGGVEAQLFGSQARVILLKGQGATHGSFNNGVILEPDPQILSVFSIDEDRGDVDRILVAERQGRFLQLVEVLIFHSFQD